MGIDELEVAGQTAPIDLQVLVVEGRFQVEQDAVRVALGLCGGQGGVLRLALLRGEDIGAGGRQQQDCQQDGRNGVRFYLKRGFFQSNSSAGSGK